MSIIWLKKGGLKSGQNDSECFFFSLLTAPRLIQSQKEREQQNKVPPLNTINSLSISKKEKKKKRKKCIAPIQKMPNVGWIPGALCFVFVHLKS